MSAVKFAHQCALRGGAAHVERQQVGKPELAPVMGRHEGSGGRAGFQRPNRKAPRRLRHDRGPGRRHHQQPPAEAEVGEPPLEPFDVASEHRLGVGVHRRRGPALVLAHVPEDLGRTGYVQVRELRLHEFARRVLVHGIGIRVQEADGERLDAGRFDEVAHRRPGALEVQGRDHLSVVTHPLRDLPAQAPWCERVGPREPKVEQVVSLLEAHVEDVAEPLGHQHAGLRPAPFDDRVGDQRRAVRDRLDLGHGHVFAPQEGGGAFNHRNRGVGRRGEALEHRDLAAALVEQCEVGERPAYVDAEPPGQGLDLQKSSRVAPGSHGPETLRLSARELLCCRPGQPRVDMDCNPDPAIERSEDLHPSVPSPFKAPCSETNRIAARDGDSRTGDAGATGSRQKDHESGDVRLAGTAERYVGVAARRHFRLAKALLGRKPAKLGFGHTATPRNLAGERPKAAVAVLHCVGMATDGAVRRPQANIGLRASWASGIRLRKCLRVARQLESSSMKGECGGVSPSTNLAYAFGMRDPSSARTP